MNGLLSVANIKAFNQLCAEAGAKDQCAKGPLSGEAADLVANFIYAARPTT